MMNKFKNYISNLLLSSIFFVASATAQSKAIVDAKVGLLIPLTGQYAALGSDCQQGIDVAKAELGPFSNINFILADSRAEPAQAVTEFRKLVDLEKVAATVVIRGPPGMAVNPLSKSAKIPLLGSVGNKNFALSNEFAFQFWPRSDFEGEFISSSFQRTAYKTAALLTVQDDYTIAVSEGFRSHFSSHGGSLAYDQELLPTETDFRAQLGAMKRINPDVLFLNVGLAQTAPILSQVKQLGIKIPIFLSFWAGKAEVIAAAGQAAEGVHFAEMSTNSTKLKADLKAKFDSSPSGLTLACYLATQMLSQATKEVEEINPATLYSKLTKIGKIQTPNGDFEVKDRFVQFPMVIKAIRNGIVQDSE